MLPVHSGNPYQYFHYTAWGESFAQTEATQGSFSSSYRFNAKELDQETGNYYYGARYYDPKISTWLSVDPLAEKYPTMSSYCFTANNPVMLIDPDGRWIPGLDDDGNATYTAEKGDTYETFKEQYGLTDKQASAMLNPETKVEAGKTMVTGAQAKAATGSDILSLDLNSDDVTSDDMNHQFAFAISYEVAKNKTEKDHEGNFNDYFDGINDYMSKNAGGWNYSVNTYKSKPTEVNYLGEKLKITFDLRGLHDGRFEASRGDEFNLTSNKIRYGLRIFHPSRSDKRNFPIAKVWIHY